MKINRNSYDIFFKILEKYIDLYVIYFSDLFKNLRDFLSESNDSSKVTQPPKIIVHYKKNSAEAEPDGYFLL